MLSTVLYRRRAIDCRYGMCQVGARVYFRPRCGRLQSAFDEQERGKRGGLAQDTTMVVQRVRDIVVTVYLALILKDGDD